MLVTSQLRATAALQILLPRNPLPPQTMSFFFAWVEAAVVDMVGGFLVGRLGFWGEEVGLVCERKGLDSEIEGVWGLGHCCF